MKFIRAFLFLFLMLGAREVSAAEPVRTWTNPEGRSFEARMLSSAKDSVTVMTTPGLTYIIPFDKLSESDVAYVKSHANPVAAAKVSKGGWLEDVQAAKQAPSADGRPILMLFTGSDWCPPCRNLEETVLSKLEFQQFAEENLVLLVVDFPRRKKQDAEQKRHNFELQQQYGISGYPTLVMTDAEGKTLSKFGYGGQKSGDFVAMLKKKVPAK